MNKNCFFTDVDKIIKRINFFINNKAWYESRGIPYQLGFLFYGPPGCGKTSTIKAISRLLDRHIVNVNDIDKIKKVSDIKNIFYGDYINGRHIPTHKRLYVIDEFDKILDTISEKPAIANAAAMNAMSANLLNGIMGMGMSGEAGSGVIVVDSDTSSCENGNGNSTNENGKRKSTKKDEDGIMKGKQHGPSTSLMKQKSVINDADILTIMDGLVETSGRIIICTANDPSKISEPFKRPGRLDEHIEFTKCTRSMVIQLLELFYSTTLIEEQMAKINNIENDIQFKYSPAEINKFCFNNLSSVNDVISEILS